MAVKNTDDEALWRQNLAWWDRFWQRSHIIINANRGEGDEGWRVGRNYNLFRYMFVSGCYASEPLMFNGGVLTFDAVLEGKRRYADSPESKLQRYGDPEFDVQNGEGYTPDYRRWGAAFRTTPPEHVVSTADVLFTGHFPMFSLTELGWRAGRLLLVGRWLHHTGSTLPCTMDIASACGGGGRLNSLEL